MRVSKELRFFLVPLLCKGMQALSGAKALGLFSFGVGI
jgi:hypothetical protein